MPSLRRSVGLAVAVILALPAAASARAGACRSDGAPAAGALAAAARRRRVRDQRRARAARPARALERPRLDRAGARYARRWSPGGFFSHTSPDGRRSATASAPRATSTRDNAGSPARRSHGGGAGGRRRPRPCAPGWRARRTGGCCSTATTGISASGWRSARRSPTRRPGRDVRGRAGDALVAAPGSEVISGPPRAASPPPAVSVPADGRHAAAERRHASRAARSRIAIAPGWCRQGRSTSPRRSEVEAQLAELQDAGFACVALDLREVAFLDLTGPAGDRARAGAGAAHATSRFELVGGPPAVMRLFALAGDAGGSTRRQRQRALASRKRIHTSTPRGTRLRTRNASQQRSITSRPRPSPGLTPGRKPSPSSVTTTSRSPLLDVGRHVDGAALDGERVRDRVVERLREGEPDALDDSSAAPFSAANCRHRAPRRRRRSPRSAVTSKAMYGTVPATRSSPRPSGPRVGLRRRARPRAARASPRRRSRRRRRPHVDIGRVARARRRSGRHRGARARTSSSVSSTIALQPSRPHSHTNGIGALARSGVRPRSPR